MEDIISFFSFQDPNVRYVALGSVLIAVSSAIVGSFTFLKKKALVGDAVAHAVLPGICLAFIITGTKNPIYIILGAFVTGWISLVLIDWITRWSKIKEDTAIGLTLSVFFGIGILLLTMIQHSGNASQTGLNSFLFGKAAALVGQDLIVFSVISVLLLVVVILLYKELALICFDENFAKSIGFPVKRLELVLTTLTVLAVVTGIQAVGVVLMAAMLITPSAAAKFWTSRLNIMILLAAVFAAVSGIGGALISYTSPSMPTGPWIVMVISIIAMVSFFFAPRRGILYNIFRQRSLRKRILLENLLKVLYQLGEEANDFETPQTMESIRDKRKMSLKGIRKGLRVLKRQGFIVNSASKWQLTKAGHTKGQRIVKLHRLWEVYLTQYLRIAPDHVHEDADNIEHFLTPELEKRLEAILDFPTNDPHSSAIPYDQLTS